MKIKRQVKTSDLSPPESVNWVVSSPPVVTLRLVTVLKYTQEMLAVVPDTLHGANAVWSIIDSCALSNR